jgi:hypothetical protein
MAVYLSACLSLSACLPVCLSACLPACLPACHPACHPACLPIDLPTLPSVLFLQKSEREITWDDFCYVADVSLSTLTYSVSLKLEMNKAHSKAVLARPDENENEQGQSSIFKKI